MKKVPFRLKDLSIHKMPGFPRGLESMKGFEDQINIIAGANASGKSSTARIIQQLIWHDNTSGMEADGSFFLDKEPWKIRIDSTRVLIQRNGQNDELTGLPPAEGKHRYLLALDKLVDDNESDLAKEISKQSIGGYDLDAVKQNLDYSPNFYKKTSAEHRTFTDAEKKYKQVLENQKKLKTDEEKLTELYEEKKRAQYAARSKEFYKKVAELLEARSEYSRLVDRISEFPEAMEKVTGTEFEQIEDLENKIRKFENAIKLAKDNIEKSKDELKKLTIPADGISDKTIRELENRLDNLTDLERDILEIKKKIDEFRTKEEEALKAINNSLDPASWEGLNIDNVSGLDKLLKDANQVLGEKEAILARIKTLEDQAKDYPEQNQDTDTMVLGIKTLSYWLKDPAGTAGMPLWTLVAMALAGVATTIATYFTGWPGLAGIVLIAGLFLYAYATGNKKSDKLSVRKDDFNKTGLTPPAGWDIENVAARIDELIKELTNAEEQKNIRQKLIDHRATLENLQDRLEKIDVEHREWLKKLQVVPGFPEIKDNDFSSLYWFLIHAKEWNHAHTQVRSLQSEKKVLEKELKKELNKVNALFRNANYSEVTDAAEGKAVLQDLKKQKRSYEDLGRSIGREEDNINAQNDLRKEAEEELSKIYSYLNIADHDKEKVRVLVKQVKEFKQLMIDHNMAKGSLSEKEMQLKDHSLYEKLKNEIETLTTDLALEKARENEIIADRLEEIQKQIISIETRIREKKKGNELEESLTQKEQALEGLQQLYEKNLSSVTGNLIIDLLKEETQNKNRPGIFKRANEILNNITHGRYELRLEEKEEACFKAYDTVSGEGLNLSELSTGTRVQLLLSVRLAYVDTVESSIKLPILADELLANSDDERAGAIIEALIGISKEGRQVFYFTAQTDEVNKWLIYLNREKGVKHKIIWLKSGSNESGIFEKFIPQLTGLHLTEQIPPPQGKSHEEYGEIVHVPAFNILTQKSTELPLWYLIEEVDLLYACYQKGVKSWGQLKSFYKHNGKIEKLDNDTFLKLTKKIELLERFQALYRKGRSLPIDRTVLERSGAITGNFIDEVSQKLSELNGDPARLLQALRRGEIPRFRTSNADQFEQFLLEEGYLDDQEKLETEEIIINLQAFISNHEMESEFAERFINRILYQGNITKAT